MIFYFSGTGNSEWVARKLAERTQDTLIFIPHELLKEEHTAYSLKKDERIGFVFPIYSWGPPKEVLLFLDKISLLNYESHYTYMVCTCGDDTGCTLSIFRKEIEKKKWRLNCAFSITMPNTYVSLPGFDIDNETLRKRKFSKAQKRLESIKNTILNNDTIFDVYPGTFPLLKSYIIRPIFNHFFLDHKLFHTKETCNNCGLCVRQCPMKNIVNTNAKPKWQEQCTGCLKCYHICPLHAIEYGKQTKHKGQYILNHYIQELEEALVQTKIDHINNSNKNP